MKMGQASAGASFRALILSSDVRELNWRSFPMG